MTKDTTPVGYYVMFFLIISLLGVMLFGSPAEGSQGKPYGVFDLRSDCLNEPTWIRFSNLPSWTSTEEMRQMAECSRRRGIQWTVSFGFDSLTDTRRLAMETRQRAITSGLLPYIVAVQFKEEWYGYAMDGRWGPPSFELFDAIAKYGGDQHQILREIWHLPIIYVDSFINNNRQYGLQYYKPLPHGFTQYDILALETYVPAGGSWDRDVEPFLVATLANTTQRVVLIGQTFRHPPEWNDQWRQGATREDGRRFQQWLDHPRVIAGWLFTWRDRPNGIMGIQSMSWLIDWFVRR